MIDSWKDIGLIHVLAQRLESQRLPRALSLKEAVDRGGTLTEFDIRFLEEDFQDAQRLRSLVDRHPEWQALAAKMVHLYKKITDKALENEKAKNGSR